MSGVWTLGSVLLQDLRFLFFFFVSRYKEETNQYIVTIHITDSNKTIVIIATDSRWKSDQSGTL